MKLVITGNDELIKDIMYALNHSNAVTLLESLRESNIEVQE